MNHDATFAATEQAHSASTDSTELSADVLIVGTGLAGLVAGLEAARGGRHVTFLDQENRANLGGQAFWSLGGLFYVNSPEQRLMGVKDSEELAWADWFNSADYDDADNDTWGRRWGREYVRFAAEMKRTYLSSLGVRVVPTVGWAERGSGDASGHGNSVPRFHLAWGTGPDIVRAFRDPLEKLEQQGRVRFLFRHCVDELIPHELAAAAAEPPTIAGVAGRILTPCDLPRGEASPREAVGTFRITAEDVVIATGGIGGNEELVRSAWPRERWGAPPASMVLGVPAHVDGRGLSIAEAAGAKLANTDRLWHYPEGMENWDPIWPGHGIRIIPGPSSMWFDAAGQRLGVPLIPGGDNLAAVDAIAESGYGYSWFVLNKSIVDKEFIFSGSEQNPDLTSRTLSGLASKLGSKTHVAIQNFMDHGSDWVIAESIGELVEGMNALGRELAGEQAPEIDTATLKQQILDRDMQVDNAFSKDYQVNYIRVARQYLGDKIVRCAPLHKILDPVHGPLIAVRLRMLTRKSLGGIVTDLHGRCMTEDEETILGLYAVGEVAGFGGGGMHGKNALEGTFLGGCIHTGYRVGRYLSRASSQVPPTESFHP